jgi:hypothetical protein
MTKQQKFEVLVSDYSSSVEEWKRAMVAPRSELPPLSEQQREVARKFGVSDEEYARGVLAGLYGEERIRSRGEQLGELVETILQGLGPTYRLAAIKAEMFNGRWICRIMTPEKIANVAVPRELADDVLDSGVREEIDRLKNCLLTGLGRDELIARHSVWTYLVNRFCFIFHLAGVGP